MRERSYNREGGRASAQRERSESATRSEQDRGDGGGGKSSCGDCGEREGNRKGDEEEATATGIEGTLRERLRQSSPDG
jgi:hypothetical protein